MKQVFMLVLCTLVTLLSFGERLLPANISSETKQPGLNTNQETSKIQKKLNVKKLSFKERLLWKWLEKKLNKRENSKNTVNKLGIASLIFSVIAVASISILIITDLEALLGLLLVAFLAGLIALILGVISLLKRSKLKDQTAAKAWPAIVGISLSVLLGILLVLFLVG
jgi:cation transport ATPase